MSAAVASTAPERRLSIDEILEERAACEADPAYFIHHYCYIKDDKDWIPFRLWDYQLDLCDQAFEERLLVVLKARQLGVSWLFLGIFLWGAIFEPGCLQLLFSLKHKEAKKLLKKLKGMYKRLPRWLQADRVTVNNKDDWQLSNGSIVEAYPASGGDSNNARRVLVDEADLIPNLSELLDSLGPTIEDGDSKLYMISRSNKKLPQSTYKRIYREAKAGGSDWAHTFHGYDARPDRTPQFLERQKRLAMAKDGHLDYVHSNYPETDAQALAASTGDKRLPGSHLTPCFTETKPLTDAELPKSAPAIPGLRIFKLPEKGRKYVAGADPAEGLPGPDHDDSALVVVDKLTGEEVAVGMGRWKPGDEFVGIIDGVCRFFNKAPVLVERNNHGGTTLHALKRKRTRALKGPDKRPGYFKNQATKAAVWDLTWGLIVERARAIADAETERAALIKEGKDPERVEMPPPLVRDFVVHTQLVSLESGTCKAPKGEKDDGADAHGLAQMARTLAGSGTTNSMTLEG